MKRNIFFTICLLMFVGVGSLSAQPTLTLEQYRQQVIDYSNQLKISSENTSAAIERFKMVRTGYLPSLGLAANGSYQEGNEMSFGATSMKNYNYSSTLSLQQNIYAGGAVRANTKAADIEHSIAQKAEALTLQNVVYAADLTYWAFAASFEQREIAATYVSIVRSLYDIVNIRFTDGYISRTDVLMVETRLNEAELQMISANQQYLNSLQQLSTMIGQNTITEYAVGDSISKIPSIDAVTSRRKELTLHPEYMIAKMQVDLQNQNIKVARSRYNPQFNVGLQAVYGTPSLNFTGNPKFYGIAFASLNIPIFMWGERRHSVAIARTGVRSSEYSLLNTRDQLNEGVNKSLINLDQILKQTQIAERNLSVAKENLDLNTFSYSEGRLPILDVLQSQLAWIQAYTAFVNTNYNYQTAVASYYKAAGIFEK